MQHQAQKSLLAQECIRRVYDRHSRVNARQGRVRKQVLAASRRLPSPSYPPPCLSRHFVLGQGRGSRALCRGFRGSRARAGALCPWPKGSPRVPLGGPWGPWRHMSGPLDVFEGFSGTTSKSRRSEAVKLEWQVVRPHVKKTRNVRTWWKSIERYANRSPQITAKNVNKLLRLLQFSVAQKHFVI